MKYIGISIALLLTLMYANLHAQCGAELTEEDHAYIQSAQTPMRSFNANITRGVRDFPVKVHIVRRANRMGGMNEASLMAALQQVNEYYINANLRFVMLKGINYIDSDKYYNFSNAYEQELCSQHDKDNVINLYFFGTVYKGKAQVCGYSYYPNKSSSYADRDRIILDNACVDGGTTLIHELGHFFSLYHTHGRGKEKELVTRSVGVRNCEKAGDNLCDTPADPMIINEVDRSCNYTGTRSDARGEKYKPDPKNIMAYSADGCRQRFSKGQFGRINYAALNMRGYMTMPKGAAIHNITDGVKKPTVTTTPRPPKPTTTTKPPPKHNNTTTQQHVNTSITTTSSKDNILSGEIMLQISGRAVDMTLDGNLYRPTRPFYSGTNYQISMTNNDIGFVYVIGADLTKKNTQIFPQTNQTAYISVENSRMTLPSGGSMFQMDQTKGKDYICVLYSKRPIRMDLVMQEMERMNGNFMQRLYKVLWHQLVPQNHIEYKNISNRLVFSANAGQHSIVPLVIELEHE